MYLNDWTSPTFTNSTRSYIQLVEWSEREELATRSFLPAIDPKDKGKCTLIEPVKLSNVQVAIKVAMQRFDGILKERLEMFDKWFDYLP